jgi:hypothetical protein
VTAFDKAGICMKSVGKTAVDASRESNQLLLECNAGTVPTEALIFMCFFVRNHKIRQKHMVFVFVSQYNRFQIAI